MIVLRRLAASHYKGLIDVSLRLPERGSVLIEGRNEAGKSTLFDAVHFSLYGRPLVGDQPDAIHYGADQAVVELDLTVDNTELRVRRAIRQTAKTMRAEAELEVRRQTGLDPADVEIERVRGAAAVNQRLQLELGGLTAEALLNSCLVAQKQLGRLEDLARGSREAALTVLLNLGKLSDVHQRLRVRPEDEEQLRRARARLELSRVAEQLASLDERRAALERARRLAELRATLDQLGLVTDAMAELREEAKRLAAELGAVRRSLDEVERARGELAAWQRLLDASRRLETLLGERVAIEERLRSLAEVEQALPARRAALEEARALRASAQALVDAEARIESLGREGERVAARQAERAELTSRCGRLDEELEQLRKQHREIQAQIQQLAPLTTQLEGSRVRQRGLAALQREVSAAVEQRAAVQALTQRAVRAGELLTRWIELRRAELEAEQIKRLLDDLSLSVAGMETVSEPARRGAEDATGVRLRLLVDHPLTGALSLQLRLWPGGAELTDVRVVSAKEAERLTTSGVPTLSAASLEEARRERRAVGSELEALGERVPRDLAAAEQRLGASSAHAAAEAGERAAAEHAARCLEEARALRIDVDDVTIEALPPLVAEALRYEAERQAELSSTAGRREGLLGQLTLLERNGKDRKREVDECRASLERDSDEQLQEQRQEIERRIEEAAREAAALRAALVAALGDKESESAREAAQRRVDALSTDVALIERQLAERDALRQRAEGLAEAVAHAETELLAAQSAANGTVTEAPDRIAALGGLLEQLGEPTLRVREQEVQRAAGAVEARLHRSEEDARSLGAAGARLAAELGHQIDPARLAEEAAAALPEVMGALTPPDAVEAQLGALAQERGALERGAADARVVLGDEAAIPRAEAELRLRLLEEDLAARRRGQEIVSLTRQRMINKVLPDTINNMCVLLPQLTADRYRYAELTPDYKLQVWDERARAYVEKNLFSGGTQDQFSLALRLGFALAALPRELGTSPGFLFLDEPLSSFDRDRTEALVALLTRGQVSTFFRQVLLISHSQAFDPELFSHHVLMEHGRVAESTLPSDPPASGP